MSLDTSQICCLSRLAWWVVFQMYRGYRFINIIARLLAIAPQMSQLYLTLTADLYASDADNSQRERAELTVFITLVEGARQRATWDGVRAVHELMLRHAYSTHSPVAGRAVFTAACIALDTVPSRWARNS